ncbi:DNA repair protein complementing XP-C cells homolog [Condylostylus longicornis]|uniref:DNA repair protein complementing XP-C cells homolog n=1 Tax=Condylostylus longicornis TaxID=2530218 RepID=UPI00244E07D3|nr:DNA repair protein complementing XP-C cells homolog [Condylostylus longicornis]
MSDDEDFNSESENDFSASEDEWTPAKNKEVEHSEDEEDVSSGELDEDFAVSPPPKKKRETTKSASKGLHKTKKLISKLRVPTLRDKMFKRYNPPPKTIATSITSVKSSNLNTTKENDGNDSDSGSSVENFLVDPEKLDLKSSFFDVKSNKEKSEQEDDEAPNFDCNLGLSTNISDNEDDMESIKEESGNENNEKSCADASPFKQFYEYKNAIDEVKKNSKSGKSNTVVHDKKDDVSSLLALGEASTSKIQEEKKSTKSKLPNKIKNSDSEWEEVEEEENDENAKLNDGIEITVGFPENHRREKRTTDEQAQLMRRLNRIIKENCMIFHKVSLLCNIAHGVYLNRALNNTELMAQALKLLPSEKSYPNGRTCIKYFESISKWYKAVMQLKSENVYSDLKTKSAIPVSLALQIKSKSAICKKDFVLIFIVLLRAMGIQCRLIMNLVTLPIKPAAEDLCSLKTKKPEGKKDNLKSVNKTKTVDTKKVNKKISIEEPKTIEKIKDKVLDSKPNEIKNSVETRGSSKTTLKKGAKVEKLNGSDSSKPKIKVTEADKQETPEEKHDFSPVKTRTQRKAQTESMKTNNIEQNEPSTSKKAKNSNKSRSPSPKFHISPHFIKTGTENSETSKSQRLIKSKKNNEKTKLNIQKDNKRSPSPKIVISSSFFQKSSSNIKENSFENKSQSLKEKLKIPQLDGANSLPKKKTLKEKVYADNSDTDTDFETSPPKKPKLQNKLLSRVKDRRVLSTDDEDAITNSKKKSGMNIWVEVYSETEDQWICIDLFKTKIHCVDSLRREATSPVSYVFAWNNDNSLKDVSPRYCPQWNTVTRKQRVDKQWLDIAIRKYLGVKNSRDIAEDRELEKIHMDKPLPTTINEFKNHPLYALERHLLKFEGIYPPNAPTLGFIRGEPIYPRDCVHLLHSREIWLKAAKVVKPGEKPYKIVKARPKWDKMTSSVIKDQPLEIFGYWQTQDYEPPTAENGIVPRNAYGNVELFKPTMLPKKTVHLQLPGLSRICKKLRIDCAPAVIGFDFHQGSCHPLLDGFVVCEEFKDQVVQAWEEDQEEHARKELEKYESRVYGNWKRLIKGLLIREKLKIKYNFGDMASIEKTTSKRKK